MQDAFHYEIRRGHSAGAASAQEPAVLQKQRLVSPHSVISPVSEVRVSMSCTVQTPGIFIQATGTEGESLYRATREVGSE